MCIKLVFLKNFCYIFSVIVKYARIAVLVDLATDTKRSNYTCCEVNARIAQLVEHTTDTGGVPSSNLGTRTNLCHY